MIGYGEQVSSDTLRLLHPIYINHPPTYPPTYMAYLAYLSTSMVGSQWSLLGDRNLVEVSHEAPRFMVNGVSI